MAIINIDRNNIPLKAYLRADPNSQHFKFSDNSEELVTYDMFWKAPIRIYLDYSEINNRSIQVSKGISAKTPRQTLHDSDCDKWIEQQFGRSTTSKLIAIEGYAGCGKTTFINHLIGTYQNSENYIHVDIGKSWTYPREPFMFFDESLYAFDCLVDRVLAKPLYIRHRIWNSFFELGNDPNGKELGKETLSALIALKKVKENSATKKLKENLHRYLDEHYNNRDYQEDLRNSGYIWHSTGQTQIVVMLLILLKCAEYSVIKKHDAFSNNFSLYFDNSDIITDPAIPAENVALLWGVIDRYVKFKTAYHMRTNNDLPDFTVFVTVRKVLFFHITSYLPNLEMNHPYDMNCANTCDISNLFSSQDILAHRISYWSKYTEDKHTLEKFSQIRELISIQTHESPNSESNDEWDYIPKNHMNLDAFVNHNYRAFSNALAALLDNPRYTKLLLRDYRSKSTEHWQKVSTLIFCLSLLYRSGSVWNAMGFGCNDFSLIDYPTTLNRLILNYLYAAKQGQNLHQYATDQSGMLTNANVPLKDIIDVLAKVSFLTVETKLAEKEIVKKYESSVFETKDLILERLADMCGRTSGFSTDAYGYDTDDDELWRRPLYFSGGLNLNHTAASHTELKKHFEKSIEDGAENEVMFAITDEGFVLINDIVATFEFYSARYCNAKVARPLHQAASEDELNTLIQPVYNAVKKCCKRNIVFKDQYLKQYHKDLNQYLEQYFHPRTKPRFEDETPLPKKLDTSSFRPQLHIVRVIYAHIGYFNAVKRIFAASKRKTAMCKCLTVWIEAYLELYKEYFFPLLKDTICNSDNNVYNTLIRLKDEQLEQYVPGGSERNIDISKKRVTHRKKSRRS